MLPRFYAPDLDPESGSARLSPDEAHHLTRVLRLVAGDTVTVSHNGTTIELRARVNRSLRAGIVRIATEHAGELGGKVEVAK